MAADQASDPEVQALRMATTGLQLQVSTGEREAEFPYDNTPTFSDSPDRFPVKDLRALAREADKVLNSSRMPGPAVRVVGAADVQAIREDVIAATQRQRPTAGLCYYHASLLVDVRNRRLVNAETFATLPGSPSSTGTSKLSSALSSADMFQRLLMDFPDLTTPTFSWQPSSMGWIICSPLRVRRSTPGQGGWTRKLAVAKAEFDSMEQLGIVRRSSSPWASPLHLVPKTGVGALAGTIDDLMTHDS
ncbi:hypothetical protein AAFF_G00031170 [Aldrovandia affinis]|uniref:Uncharacterized protein n=1 Tax=Aldrovandia affinis TaxID=143900 RepID=A0AAD7WFX7_9TELE|nr:hypothetical protein AAFF_G00031170 [Aldrovandia affinis]